MYVRWGPYRWAKRLVYGAISLFIVAISSRITVRGSFCRCLFHFLSGPFLQVPAVRLKSGMACFELMVWYVVFLSSGPDFSGSGP